MAWANRVQVCETASSEGGMQTRAQAARIEPRVN